MLSIARCCTRALLKTASLRNGFGVQSFNSVAPKCQYADFGRRLGVNLLQKNQNSFLQSQGMFRKTGTFVLRYVSDTRKKSQKIVGSWLLLCGGMVFVAVTLGGVTRLTESGLSMVTWKFLGEKMPSTETDWIEEFERYKEYPEYKITNKDMTLEEFKNIWWMEYLHRMWGRLIGVTFALPATYFWATGMLSPPVKKRVLALGTLIGVQGLMGWYMVKSGLEDRFDGPSDVPRVSQYRLAAHLGLALVLYTGFIYNALDHLLPAKKIKIDFYANQVVPVKSLNGLRKFKKLVYATKGLVFLTAISGAFVAGLDAGMIYNTFPKMGGRWIPQDIFAFSPTLKNFTENPTTVQFDHRILGISTVTLITVLAILKRKHKLPGRASGAIWTVVSVAYLQATFGILTLVHHVFTPLAAIHQSGSLLLLGTVTWLCHEMRHVKRFLK